MKRKKSVIAATLTISAATLALTGAAAMASVPERSAAPSGEAVTKVGKIVPVNMLSGANGYSFEKATTECCGIHVSCECPEYKGAATN